MPKNKPFFNQIDCRNEKQLTEYADKLKDTHIVFPLTIKMGGKVLGYCLNYRQKAQVIK